MAFNSWSNIQFNLHTSWMVCAVCISHPFFRSSFLSFLLSFFLFRFRFVDTCLLACIWIWLAGMHGRWGLASVTAREKLAALSYYLGDEQTVLDQCRSHRSHTCLSLKAHVWADREDKRKLKNLVELTRRDSVSRFFGLFVSLVVKSSQVKSSGSSRSMQLSHPIHPSNCKYECLASSPPTIPIERHKPICERGPTNYDRHRAPSR